ncbi:hypothetical protein Tco_0073890 [Tanacetum coccineum]
MENDVIDVVSYFFQYGQFPKGSNSSFITLIPKTNDAKMVKDFLAITLIGSLYKIIGKILANHLVVILRDIVDDVQSAFVANRQILDGPFILNELFQWRKKKKNQTMIFKSAEMFLSCAGSKVGCLRSRESWNDIVNNILARLSTWKMRTLSIGGRLTLLKFVLEHNGKKPIWVKWSKVLTSKEKRGLRVSSFYALNRALLFK